ncbi:MAG: carboxypeptidase regulatory-like domain-containing protein [Myxococcota bacterium]
MPRRRIGLIVGVLVLFGLSWAFRERFDVDAPPPPAEPNGPDPFAAPEPSERDAARARRDQRYAEARRRADVPAAPRALVPPEARGDAAPDARHGRLEGTVLSRSDGEPVAGAELTFEVRGASRSVRSDAQGRFRLEAREPGPHVLAVAEAEGFFPWSPTWGHSPVRFDARPGRVVRGLRVRLDPKRVLAVEVVDDEGRPMAGATVEVRGALAGPVPLEPAAPTDAEGRTRLAAPRDAIVEARAEGPRVGRARVDLAAELAGRLRITLAPSDAAVAIAGRVVDTEGQPVDAAWVRARRSDAGPVATRPLHPEVAALTDAEGAFVLRGLDPGAHDLEVRAAGHAREASRVDAPAADVRLVLGAAAGIRGRVVDPEGAPLAAFAVVVDAVIGPVERSLREVREVYADDGRFEVGGLGSGPFEVRAIAEGHAPSAPVAVDLRPGSWREVGDVTLRSSGRIRGVVRGGPEGRTRLEDARVSLEGRGTDGALAVRREARSDQGGNFVLEGVGEGPRSLTVAAPGHHARILSGIAVVAGETRELEVALDPTEGDESPRLQLVGIGAVLSADGDVLVVGGVLPGGGAERAGIAPGDAILAVDGASVEALGFGGAIERIRGAEGSLVSLRVRRGEDVREVSVERVRVET